VRLAVAATSSVAQPTLDALLKGPHTLVRIFTTADKPSGRGLHLQQSEVATWAQAHSIECIKVSNASEMAPNLDDIDCVVTIAFGILLPQGILDLPRYGFINLHFSLLPAWRGAAPVQRAIENGDPQLGITVFKLDAGMDTGPIYTSATVERDLNIRTSEALELLARLGIDLIFDALQKIETGVTPTPQSADGATRAFKLNKKEAKIEWSTAATAIHQKVAAFYPNPVAFTYFREDVLKISMSAVAHDLEGFPSLTPGEIYADKKRVFVGTGSGNLELLRVIPQGKAEMNAIDWARGARLCPGEICG